MSSTQSVDPSTSDTDSRVMASDHPRTVSDLPDAVSERPMMQPLAGVLTDAIGARRIVTVFLVGAGVGQLLFAFAPSLPVALFGRALTGLGASVLYVGAAKIMAAWFRSTEFGTLTGLWTSVANLGGLTAAAPLMVLITLAGWRLSLGGVGVVVLVTAFLIYVFVRDSPAERGLPSLAERDDSTRSPVASPAMPLGRGVRVVLCEPNTWLLGGYAFLLFGTMTMMQGLWAVPYLMDVYGQTQQQAANAEPNSAAGYMSKAARVLSGWHHDAAFLDGDGHPRVLPLEGEGATFAELVRRYGGGDIPAGALLKELQLARAVERDADGNVRALTRVYLPRRMDEGQIRLWGNVLQDVGATLEHNLTRDAKTAPRFERRALSVLVDKSAVPAFKQFLEREGQAFLERVDDWLTAHQVREEANDDAVRLGAGVYHIEDARARGKSR